MSSKAKSNSGLGALIQVVVGAAVGAGGMLFIMKVVPWPDLEMSRMQAAIALIGLAAVFFVVLVVHEAGHLVAGALARFQPCLFIAGPLKLERHGSGWSVGLNRGFSVFGGMAGGIPQGSDRLRERMLMLIAGGPGASVIFGLLAFLALIVLGLDPDQQISGARAIGYVWLFVFAAGSTLVGLAALVPGHGSGMTSDGGRILRFLKSGPETDGEVALLALIGASMGGQRPREWDSDLVRRILVLPAHTNMGAAARIMAHSYYLDRGAIDEARAMLGEALDNLDALPGLSKPAVFLAASYFRAVHDRSLEDAKRFLSDAGSGGALVPPHSRLIAEAAIAAGEGRTADARALLDAAEKQLHASIDRGGAEMAQDHIDDLRKDLKR